MPLQKKTLSFALVKGIDEKSSDPVRTPDGLVTADNVVFNKKGRAEKRGGFVLTDSTTTKLAGGSISAGKAISKYGNETLIFDGSDMYSKIEGAGLVNKGTYTPCTLENKVRHRSRDRRQGNAQIAENNGIRVYVWEEYEFQGTKYNTYVDIEHIATGAALIATTQMSSENIQTNSDASGPDQVLYLIAQPQCATIGDYIFIVYQESGNMRYRYVLCSSVANADAVSAEQNLLNSSDVQVAIDTTYPVFQIDKFSGATHSDAIVFAYYAGSNNLKVQYLTASGAVLSMPTTVQTIGNIEFLAYDKATGPIYSGIFLKCLNDETDGNSYTIIVGATANDSGTRKVAIVQLKDNLTAKIEHTLLNTYPNGSTTGNLRLLNGTAGVYTTGNATIGILAGLWAGDGNVGVQHTVVPEHYIARISISRGGSAGAIALAGSALAFNASITSDLFTYNGDLFAVITQVNDNALYFDADASDLGAERGLNNNSILVNYAEEPIGALKNGQCASCLTSEYGTINPTTANSGRENRRLIHGVQRVTSRNSGTAFLFGASRFDTYAYHDAGAFSFGDYPDNVFGISLFEVDFAPDRTLASVDIENAWVGSGGFIHGYDGDSIFENNFVNYPAIKSVTESAVTEADRGFSDAKVIKHCAIYTWTDAKGNIHRSVPSQFVETTLTVGKVSAISTDVSGGVGAGYTAGIKTVTNTGGATGVGLTLTIGVTAGAITSVAITTEGSGYETGDTVTVDSGSSAATLTLVSSGQAKLLLNIYIPGPSRKSGHAIELYRTDTAGERFYIVGTYPVPAASTAAYIQFIDFPYEEEDITARPTLYTTDFPGTGFAGCSTDLVRHQNKLISAGVDDEISISNVIDEGVAPGFPMEYGYSLRLSGDPGKITAIESNLDNLLVFTETNGFYVAGSGPDIIGQGAFGPPRLFASDQGSKPGGAHTDTPLGVFYQTDRGIYLIGRDMSVNYIGAGVEDTVGANTAINMLRHDDTNTVRIMLQATSPEAAGTDVYCIYDYYFKQWATFGVAYQSSAYQVGEIYDGASFQRLVADGKQFEQSTTVFQDHDTAGASLVNYDVSIKTGFISPTGLMKKDRIYRVMLLGQYVDAHEIDLVLYQDYSGTATQTVEATLSSAPTGLYLYRAHVEKQKSRAIQLKLVLTGSTACANIEAFALETGMRPEPTTFKTIATRTL